MKNYIVLASFLTSFYALANTYHQVDVTGFGRATGPRGGLACKNAERQAIHDLELSCSRLGPDAVLIEQSYPMCSCIPSNDRMFEKCSATAYGICEL